MKNLSFFPIRILSIVVAMSFIGTASSLRASNADNNTPGKLSRSDYKFACEAAAGGMMEVELGRIASEKGINPDVKKFGERMVTDHSKAGDKLKEIAASKGAVLPDGPTAEQQKEIDRLNGLSGAEFDKEYVHCMLKDHKKDLREFQNAAKNVDDKQLQSFASETAVVIQEHLDQVKSLDDQVKKAAP